MQRCECGETGKAFCLRTIRFPSSPSLLPLLSVCSFSFWSVQLHLNDPGAVPTPPIREIFPGNRQGTEHTRAGVWIHGACVCQRGKGKEATLHAHPTSSNDWGARETQICLCLVALNEELLGGKRQR